MKTKYLSVALTAILATTLTACGGGSDNDGNYNTPSNNSAKAEVAKKQAEMQAKAEKVAKQKQAELEKAKQQVEAKAKELEAKAKQTDAKAKAELEKAKLELEKAKAEAQKAAAEAKTAQANAQKAEAEAKASKVKADKIISEAKAKEDKKKAEKEALKKVAGNDPVNNVGDAANPGDIVTENVYDIQQYSRGKGNDSLFDKVRNPDKTGNASVLGHKKLNNEFLTNINLARLAHTDDKGTKDKAYDNMYVGELATESDDGGVDDSGHFVVNTDSSEKALQKLNDTTINLAEIPTNVVLGGDTATSLITNLADDTNAKKIYANGLVRVATNNYDKTVVRGQENPVFTVDKNGRLDVTQKTGADLAIDKNDVRIFGHLYKEGDEGDIPARIWNGKAYAANPFFASTAGEAAKTALKEAKEALANDEGTDATQTQTLQQAVVDAQQALTPVNSWMFDVEARKGAYAGVLAKIEKLNAELESYQKAPTNSRNTAIIADITAKLDAEKAKLPEDFQLSLNPDALHLDQVQYGRVTARFNKAMVNKAKADLAKGLNLTQIYSATKKNESGIGKKSDFDANNPNVDFYFTRGNEPATDIPEEGTYKYFGHVLGYGLDNTYHRKDDNNSHSLKLVPQEGIGNFVKAEFNAKTKDVNGSIYNVWTVNRNRPELGIEKNDLVTFEGKRQADTNAILGSSKLAYTPKAGVPKDGSFKGALFGKGATELAISVNSVKEGYETAHWGAVGGAKRGVTPVKQPNPNVEHNTETKKGK